MRIILNMDGIREGSKRLRIRTRYNRTTRDGKLHVTAQNAIIELYGHIVEMIQKAIDPNITDFIDEGEKD